MTRTNTNRRPIVWLVLIAFFVNTVLSTQPVQADVPFLPAPGRLISLTPSFSPSMILGLKVFKNNPFKFEFIMSQGDQASDEDSLAKKVFLKEQADKLVKYFLASLTIPEKDMWVNLSPYQHDRITPPVFGITEMGKDMLAQDYLLKQVTASVMYPEGNVGKEFWRKIYQEAYKRFGTTNIPVNTFNKVWILPDTAVVHENAIDNTAVIVKSRLKVMLEEDYMALNKSSVRNIKNENSDANRELSNELIRQVILPIIDKEVNSGKNFAVLRQVYNSLILAFWYKNKLRTSLISQGYVDRKKIDGVDVNDKNIDQEIYKQYLRSYKKGVYNYIKEDIDPVTQEAIPRKYFSGGVTWDNLPKVVDIRSGPDSAQMARQVLGAVKTFIFMAGVADTSRSSLDTGESEIEYAADQLKLKQADIRALANAGLIRIDGTSVASADLNQDLQIGGHSVQLDLGGLPGPKSIISSVDAERITVARLEESIPDAVELGSLERPQLTADESMLGVTPKRLAGLVLGLALLTGAASTAHANGAYKAHNIQEIKQAVNKINEAYKNASELSKTLKALENPPVKEFRGAVNILDESLSDPGFVKSLSGVQLDVLKSIDQSTHRVLATWNINQPRGEHNKPSPLRLSLRNLAKSLGGAQEILSGTNNQIQPKASVAPQPAPLTTVTPVAPASLTVSVAAGAPVVQPTVTPGTTVAAPVVHQAASIAPSINPPPSPPQVANPDQNNAPEDYVGLASIGGNNAAAAGSGPGAPPPPPKVNLNLNSISSTNLSPQLAAPAVQPAVSTNSSLISLPSNPNLYSLIKDTVSTAVNPYQLPDQLVHRSHPRIAAVLPNNTNQAVNTNIVTHTIGKTGPVRSIPDYYKWAFTNNYTNTPIVQVAVPPSLQQYQILSNQFNHLNPVKPKIENSAKFAQDVRSDNNWKILQERLLATNAPYFAVVSTDKNNMYSIERSFNKWQGDGSGHDADSYMDFVYNNGFDQNGQANVSFKIRVPPNSNQGKVDISTINKWEEIDSPEKINAWQLDHKNIYVQAFWKDKDGHQQSGVIYASAKAAKITQDFMFSALRDRLFTQELMNILGTPDHDAQVKMIGPSVGSDTQRGNIFVGARVERDDFGFITNIVSYIPARDIGVQVSKLPVAHEDVVISNGTNSPSIVKYWPYSPSQVIKTYSILTQDELNHLKDPKTANAAFNTYLYRDGNPYKRGEIVLGNNINIKDEVDARTQETLAEQDRLATKQYKKYLDRDIKLNALLSAANVGLSFTGFNAPISSAGNMLFDMIERPDQIGRFVPTEKELQKVFDDYNASQPEADRFVLTNGTLQTIKGFYTEDDMTKLNHYLKSVNDQKAAFFLLNQVSLAAVIDSYYLPTKMASSGQYQFKVPANQALYDVLSQRYISFAGELNIPNVISLLSRGQAMQYVSLQNMANNASFLDKLTSVIGVTVDLKSVMNQISGHQIFKLAPTKARINFYLFGFPWSLVHEDELVKNIDTILNDNVSDVFIVEDGHFKSTVTAFNTQEFRSLYKIVQAIPVGKISKMGIDGHALEVPVYEVEMVTPSGEHIKKAAIFTLKAAKENELNVHYDLERYENYTQTLNEGGVVLHYGSNGGTLDQNIYTGLFESFSQQGVIGYPSAYTFDQAGADQFFIRTGNLQPVQRNLDFFLNVMQAQLKMGEFQGIGKSYNAYTGESIDQPDIAGTGMVAQTIMAYEKSTGNQKYHQLLTASIKWLENVQHKNGGNSLPTSPGVKGRYAEPNAIAYAVLHNYANIYNDGKALKAAENIRQWATGLWDNERHLIKLGEGESSFSADSQTRWFLALGPQEFIHTFLNDKPQDLGLFLQAVENTFGVEVVNYHSGATVNLLDLADKDSATNRLTNLQTTQTMRIGFPEVTAEYVEVLKVARSYLSGDDLQFADTTIKNYSEQLAKMVDQNGNLPQATEKNEDTAFNGRTVVGRFSLASSAQYQLSVVLGDNVLDVNSTPMGNNLGLTPVQVKIPPHQLSFEELNQGGRVKAGADVYKRWSDFLSTMIEQDKQHHNPNLLFYDSLNNQEVVVLDDEGRVVHLVLVPSPKQIGRQADLTAENLEMNNLMNQAERGEGAFANGGVIFQTPQGQRIGTLQDSKTVDTVLKAIAQLPTQEQSWIRYKQYSIFRLRNFNVNGTNQDVVASIVFPINKTVASDAVDPSSGQTTTSIIEGGRVRFMVSDQTAVVINYDPATQVETSTKTYSNAAGSREAMVNELMGMKSSQERSGAFDGLVPIGETSTLSARYIDPTTLSMDQIDPNKVILTKRAIDDSTGKITTQAYGLFTRPVWEADQFQITENHFDDFGRFTNSVQYENIGTISEPKKGERLFENTAISLKKGQSLPVISGINLEDQKHLSWIYQKDVVHGTDSIMAFDNQNNGRNVAQFKTDRFTNPDGQVLEFHTTIVPEYKADFFGGRIAYQTIEYSGLEGSMVKAKITTTLSYDPLTGRMEVKEHDLHTGGVVYKTFIRGSENPVQERNTLETTHIKYNSDGTHFTAKTVSNDTGEVLSTKSGTYNQALHQWEVGTILYHQYIGEGSPDNIIERSETNVSSASGHLIYVDTTNQVRAIPQYDAHGFEIGRHSWLSKNGAYTIPFHHYGDYHWTNGNLTQTVDVGTPMSHQETLDTVGRSINETYGNATTKVTIDKSYEGASLRPHQTVAAVNGITRYTVGYGAAHQDTNDPSAWIQPSTVTPVWGLKHTEDYKIGDIFGRPSNILYENGTKLIIDEWVTNSNIPLATHAVNHNGRTIASDRSDLNFVEKDGLFLMRTYHSADSFFGKGQESGGKAFIAGTAIPYYSFDDSRQEITYFDMHQPFEAPFYVQDTTGEFNVPVMINGKEVPVTGIHWIKLGTTYSGDNNNNTPENVLIDTQVSFDGHQEQSVVRTVFDVAANPLEIKTGAIVAPVKGGYSYQTIKQTVEAPANDSVFINKSTLFYAEGGFVQDGETYKFDASVGNQTQNTVNNNGVRDTITSADNYDNRYPIGDIIRPENSLTASIDELSKINPNAVQVSIENGYINSNGVIQVKFDKVENYTDMVLPGLSDVNKKQVYDTLIWHKSSQQRNLVYHADNPWAATLSPWWVTADKVTYTSDIQGNPQEVNTMSTTTWSDSLGRSIFTYNTGLGLNKKITQGFNYTLPKQTSELLHSMGAVAAHHEMKGLAVPSVKGSDFLYFYANGLKQTDKVTLILTDSNGEQLKVSSDQSSKVKFWTPASFNKMFITKAKDPQEIITTESSRVDMRDKNIWVVSIPQIVQSGVINVDGPLTASLSIEGTIGPHALVSPMGVLGNGGHKDSIHVETTKIDSIIWGGDGKSVTIHVTDPKGRGNAIIETVGRNVSETEGSYADLWAPQNLSLSPSILLGALFDNSSQNPELTVFKDPARPNVAISMWRSSGYVISGVSISYKDEHNGSFVFRLGAQNGFESPYTMKYELAYIRPDMPEDIAYGADQFVVFSMGAPGGLLQENMDANIFNKITDLIRGRDNPHFELSEGQKQFLLKYAQASELAKIIREFPLANEASADPRPFWKEKGYNPPPVAHDQKASVQINGQNLKALLENMIAQEKEGDTPLLPTAVGTYASGHMDTTEYVESQKELEEIVPALIKLNMVPEAQKIIQFYLKKSQNGSLSIADSYSRKTGEAVLYDAEEQNAAPAPKSAISQIAFINNLLFLFEATKDHSYYTYAETAFDHLLMDYNQTLHNAPQTSLSNIQGGITEQKSNSNKHSFGPIQLLPVNPDSFSTASNAKFYLLLNKIVNDPQITGSLKGKAVTIAPLQKSWLKTSGLFDRLHNNFQSGIVPDSFNDLYNLQGVQRTEAAKNSKVLSDNPWATFESSRYVLEAALAAKEISPKQLEDLTSNISRYYHRQVAVNGQQVNGFDDIVRPIGRQGVIVPENMSSILYLAKLAGDQPLAGQLKAVIDTYPLVNGLLPEIISTMPPDQKTINGLGLDSGTKASGTQYRFLPNVDNTGWPASLSGTIEYYFSHEGISPYSSVIGKDHAMISIVPMILGVAGAYVALKTAAVLVPKAVYASKRKIAKLMAKGAYDLNKRIFSPELRATADERFRDDVLKVIKGDLVFQGNGGIKPRQLKEMVLSDVHIEGLFLYHSNLIRYLAAERVRRENNWRDDDPRLLDKSNPYLKSIDDLMLMLFVLIRQEIDNGDDIQIQGKLEAFLQNYYLKLKQALVTGTQENDYSAFDSIMRKIVGNFGLSEHPLDAQFNREIEGIIAKSRFSKADPSKGAAIVNELIQKGVLEDLPSGEVQLKQEKGKSVNRPDEIKGSNYDKIWKILSKQNVDITYAYAGQAGITPLMIKRFENDFYSKFDEFVEQEQLTSIAPAMMELSNYFDRLILLSLTSIFSMGVSFQNENPFTVLSTSFMTHFGVLGILTAGGTALAVLGAIFLEIKAQFKHARPNPNIARPLGAALIFAGGVLGFSLSTLSFETYALKWLISGTLIAEGLSLLNNGVLQYTYTSIKKIIDLPKQLLLLISHPVENKELFKSAYSMVLNPTEIKSALASKYTSAREYVSSYNRSPHSLLGLSLFFHLKPAISMGPWYMVTNYLFYLPLSMGIAAFAGHAFNIYNWFAIRHLAGKDFRVAIGALTYIVLIQYLAPYSIFSGLTAVFSAGRSLVNQAKSAWQKATGNTLSKRLQSQIAEAKKQMAHGEKIGLMNYGGNSIVSPVFLGSPNFSLDEFPDSTSVSNLIDAIKKSGIAIPDGKNDIEKLNKLLKIGGLIHRYSELSSSDLTRRNRLDLENTYPQCPKSLFLSNPAQKATDEILKYYDVLKANGDKSPKITMSREEAENVLNALHTAEKNAGSSLFQLIQLNNPDLPPELRIMVPDPVEADRVAQGYRLRLYLTEQLGATLNMNIAANLVAKAIEVRKFGLGENFIFYIGHNKYDAPPSATSPSQVWKDNIEIEQRDRLAMLIKKISGNAEVQYVHTHFAMKSGGMNSVFLSKEFKKLRWFFVEDRQSTTPDMQRWFSDLTNIVKDDNLAIIVANRNTTYMYNPVGAASFLVEQGFVSVGPQKVSTGWGTMQKMTYEDSLNMHSYADTPIMPLTGATSDLQKEMGLSFFQRFYNAFFGLIGFTPNATGQSEDYQALLATVHTMIAMGANPKYAFSEAIWTKMRETNNVGPWANAPVRWSAGRLQTINDYLMQNINELGPESSFARDYNINQGRFYITLPLAVLTIILAPLAVHFDLTPFQGIEGLFWSFGFGAAHVSILHGILATLRHKGYNATTGFIGAGSALAAAAYLLPAAPVILGIAIPQMVLMAAVGIAGLVAGGFIVGIADSISRFFRDKILFSNRIGVEHGGQLKGHKGINFEFSMSGQAGDTATNPFASLGFFYDQKSMKYKIFSHIENGKRIFDVSTINHSILLGGVTTLLNIVVMLKLDLVNAFMLLPALVVTAGMLVGPIMMKKKIGKETIFGSIFKIWGFIEGAVFLTSVSLLARVLSSDAPMDSGDRNLIIGGMMMAGIANAVPLIREFIAWTRYRDVPEKHITLERLGRTFNIKSISQEYKSALKKYNEAPVGQKKDAKKELDDSYKNLEFKVDGVFKHASKESKFAKWLFLGKWARATSEQARGFWSAIIVLGWFAIVPIPSMVAVSFAEYKFAFPAKEVVEFFACAGLSIAGVQVLGKTVNMVQTWFWRNRVTKLHKEVNALFAPTYTSGKHSYRQNEIEALMNGMDIFMEQGSFSLVRQGYNDVKELLKSGDQREIFTKAENNPPSSTKVDSAMQTTKTVNRIAKFVNPGGIDLSKTTVKVEAPNGGIQIAFDDPAMLRLLLNADGLAPIIYDVRPVTSSMADHFVGLDY